MINFAIVPRIRSRLALKDGEAARALELARAAVHHAFRSDQLVTQGAAKLQLAAVLSELGRHDAARAEGQAALEIYRSKGDQPGVAEVRAFLETLSAERPSGALRSQDRPSS